MPMYVLFGTERILATNNEYAVVSVRSGVQVLQKVELEHSIGEVVERRASRPSPPPSDAHRERTHRTVTALLRVTSRKPRSSR